MLMAPLFTLVCVGRLLKFESSYFSMRCEKENSEGVAKLQNILKVN